MAEVPPFTIESFYEFAKEKRLMGAKCKNCGALLLPPRPLCPKCFGTKFEWVEFEKTGRLLTYTIIHVAPKQFEPLVPYAVGIVKLKEGPNLLGMIRGVAPEKIEVGMSLNVDFDTAIPSQWPAWPRYHFRPP